MKAFLSLIFLTQKIIAISWNQEDGVKWAFKCDFMDRDIGSVRVESKDCASSCSKTNGCTHFTWTNFNGGTCWMKTGQMSLNGAFQTNIDDMICGILTENNKNKFLSAGFTYYHSYAPCCQNNPNYDPNFPISECEDYSACEYSGIFAAFADQKSFEWVKSNNIVAFFDANDPNGANWEKNYALKKIRLTKDGKTFDATIVDTCGDDDCNGCCTRNARNGYLIDIEYWTAIKNFGSTNAVSGDVEFEIIDG